MSLAIKHIITGVIMYSMKVTKNLHFLPHFQQNSPSRFGQQPGQQFDYGRSASVHGAEWNQLKVQAPLSSFSCILKKLLLVFASTLLWKFV